MRLSAWNFVRCRAEPVSIVDTDTGTGSGPSQCQSAVGALSEWPCYYEVVCMDNLIKIDYN